MPKQRLRYDRMVEAALRGVVRDALQQVAGGGLPGNHHFYITFRTVFPGVKMPPYLRRQYPNEMTVVLQYQFYGLEIREDGFSVTLSFNNIHERLVIPFASIVTFADPSVNFALQFHVMLPSEAVQEQPLPEDVARLPEREHEQKPASPSDSTSSDSAKVDSPKRGEVVALDAFRKKS
ncbi:Stringent starvation protein B [Azospirillaceae bacterium]